MTTISARSRGRDFDETRRLLYMALLSSQTERYELAGTLAHALVHHSGLEADADDVMARVVALMGDKCSSDDRQWARQLIDRCAAPAPTATLPPVPLRAAEQEVFLVIAGPAWPLTVSLHAREAELLASSREGVVVRLPAEFIADHRKTEEGPDQAVKENA